MLRMNSMNNVVDKLIEEVNGRFNVLHVDKPMHQQVSFDFNQEDIHGILAWFKNSGWRQLSIISCVDWIAENKFQLVYILTNWTNGVRIQVRTKIDRDNAVFSTITNIYPGAQYYERDVHEFFGIKFEGNPNSEKQLFLEGWDDMPPLRKDFDPKAYSDSKYDPRKYKKDFRTERGDGK